MLIVPTVRDFERSILILDDAIGWALSKMDINQATVCHQLDDVGFIGMARRAGTFQFDRNEKTTIITDYIIGSPNKFQLRIMEQFGQVLQNFIIGIEQFPFWLTAAFALALADMPKNKPKSK